MDTTIDTAYAEEVGAFASRISGAFSDELYPSDCIWVARAPAALDVMGGIAEHGGAVTLSAPTGRAVFAAVAHRRDQTVVVDVLDAGGNGHDTHAVWDLAGFYAGPDRLADDNAFRSRFGTVNEGWARPVAAALLALLRDGGVPHLGGGLTLVFRSTLPGDGDAGRIRAVQTATIAATTGALGAELKPIQAAQVARSAYQLFPGAHSSLSQTVCSFLGRPDSLLQMRCQPVEVIGSIRFPQGVAVLGIHSGYQHPAGDAKYRHAQVAARMGRTFVERALRATGTKWDGCLSRITVTEYVERIRDRLPTKMKGRAFLERFGDVGGDMGQIDSNAIYKIRSRTEHHIYENDRVHQFVERLSRVARTRERTALIEAGELMYASHWSYGQRCGLGSVATDCLVSLLRERGCGRGIYGARVSGNGAGGVVVALIDDTPPARDAVHEATQAYRQKTGHETCIVDGSSPGAFITGARAVP
jgi:L-arabinokinase